MNVSESSPKTCLGKSFYHENTCPGAYFPTFYGTSPPYEIFVWICEVKKLFLKKTTGFGRNLNRTDVSDVGGFRFIYLPGSLRRRTLDLERVRYLL